MLRICQALKKCSILKFFSASDLSYFHIDIFFIVLYFSIENCTFKKLDPRYLNVENLEETEYDEFQVSGDDTIPEMAFAHI